MPRFQLYKWLQSAICIHALPLLGSKKNQLIVKHMTQTTCRASPTRYYTPCARLVSTKYNIYLFSLKKRNNPSSLIAKLHMRNFHLRLEKMKATGNVSKVFININEKDAYTLGVSLTDHFANCKSVQFVDLN